MKRNYNTLREAFHLFLMVAILSGFSTISATAQDFKNKLVEARSENYQLVDKQDPFTFSKDQNLKRSDFGIAGEKLILNIAPSFNKKILGNKNELVKLAIPLNEKTKLDLHLKQVEILSPDFILTNSKDELQNDINPGKFYWGYVDGHPESVVALNVFKDEISGSIDLGDKTYTIGKLKSAKEYVLYREEQLVQQTQLSCFADDLKENVDQKMTIEARRSPPNVDNCVRMYIEIDNDLFVNKGSINATYNYFAGAFSQVAILYANENIEITLNQVKVWDQVDPYTGPSTGDFMGQFMDEIGSNYNGTLAHLVGMSGGGGIAYVNVVCNKAFGFGYSGIGTQYSNVPAYSWTVNVLTHEIGHNLGSTHTHSCAWNGNNTQIDDCGNAYITEPGACYDPDNPIIPNKGTIMSYCHLGGSPGIDFNLGFGPQPGDVIRDRVHNASCLSECVDCTQQGQACDDGDPCTTDDTYDSYCNCTGISTPDNDEDGVCATLDPDDNDICVPNACNDCTITTIEITLDNYPAETSWAIVDQNSNVIASGGGYSNAYSTISTEVCIEDGCFDFVISDTYGDGICCSYGSGSYTVTDSDNNVLASGGSFGFEESTNFCYSNFTGCTDADQDDICDDVDPCYDPLVMDMGDMLEAGSYNARQEIILNVGTEIPDNATIYLNAPVIKFMENTTIPENTVIHFNESPCEN